MKFLGLRLCEHDSNITYTDGVKVKYYKSERDLQRKHHGFNNLSSWEYVLKRWNVTPSEIDAVGIVIDADKHEYLQINDTIIHEYLDIPVFEKMGFKCPIHRIDHHLAHALSVWPLDEGSHTALVFDGWGDDNLSHSVFWNTERQRAYSNDDCMSLGQIMPHYAGHYMGIEGNPYDFAGKLMALKGFSRMLDDQHLLGQLECFSIEHINHVWGVYGFEMMDWERRCDYIGLWHEATERIFGKYFASQDALTISFSGGVAQNSVLNTAIRNTCALRNKRLVIPPHCSDEGLSLGIVEYLRQHYQQEEEFDRTGFPFWQDDEAPDSVPTEETITEVAEMLANGAIVGWYQGQGEIGSRALGNRSILMNPTLPNGKDIINQRVKHREWFRPFGASVLEEHVDVYFKWTDPTPHMLYVADVREPDRFPAISHVDGTSRIQTVDQSHTYYYQLIDKFNTITGIPMVLNTSLNNNGKPIAGHIQDAVDLLHQSDLDCVVAGNDIIRR